MRIKIGQEIWIAEDETRTRFYLKNALSGNYQVEVFTSGIEIVAKYQAGFRPDLIIADMQMPIMDGLPAIGNIREINPKQKFIAISGDFSGIQLAEMKNLGIECLNKPFGSEELKQAVETALGD